MFMFIALRSGCYGSYYSVLQKTENVKFTKTLEAAIKGFQLSQRGGGVHPI